MQGWKWNTIKLSISYVSFKCSEDHQRFRSFCKKFISSLFLPFLLRCTPFLPRCTSLIFTLSIKSTSNCPKSLLKLDKVRAALPLSVRIVGLETITLQVGNVFIMYCFSWSNSSRICLDVFETASFVPICIIMCSGFFLSKGTRWCFRSSIVAPLKSWTFTTWLFFKGHFLSTPVSIESPNIKQVPAGHACLKFEFEFHRCWTYDFFFAAIFWTFLFEINVMFFFPHQS